jgi:acyl-CoA reductase-like NAD-dependent aldehyde dehydrogenase
MPDAAEKTRARIASATAAGARIVFAAESNAPQTIGPVILENAPVDHEICACELFAPIATLHRYATVDEALALVNHSSFGLQCGIFTRDLTFAMRAHERLEVGAVLINQVPTFRVENMPYGGVKDSGFGREGIRYAMEDMTEPRALIIHG